MYAEYISVLKYDERTDTWFEVDFLVSADVTTSDESTLKRLTSNMSVDLRILSLLRGLVSYRRFSIELRWVLSSCMVSRSP